MSDFYDMVIIGAGLSGVGSACRYIKEMPHGKLAVLEARDAIGGTWDLFRYPGVRSDSDMLTLGYDFRPWPGTATFAKGEDIRDYIRTVAKEYGVDKRIQFNSRVTAMDFSTADDLWTVTITDSEDGSIRTIRTRFILSCAGYYRYDQGHDPHFDGRETFKGDIIHPQFWPEDYDYSGKRIAVIGSGATAVTLLPQLAKTAAHVTQIQRTPSYVASLPGEDRILKLSNWLLPKSWAFKLNRWKNIALSRYFYGKAQRDPEGTKKNVRKKTLKALGGNYPVDTHFNPPYDPWDQRFCLVPDNDMFDAINRGDASIVTGHIEQFEPEGVRMKDGSLVEADLIVTATGLEIVFSGDADIRIDGQSHDIGESYGFKGLMFSGVPNLVSVFGYTNASWTLRADLMGRYAIRLSRFMEQKGVTRAVPIAPAGMKRRPWLDFQAGYLQRVIDDLPNQGDRMPWLNIQDYKHDLKSLIEDPIPCEGLEFSTADPSGLAEAAE